MPRRSSKPHGRRWPRGRAAETIGLVATGAFKSSFGFPGRHEAENGVISPQHVFLSSAEERGMLDAAHRSALGIK